MSRCFVFPLALSAVFAVACSGTPSSSTAAADAGASDTTVALDAPDTADAPKTGDTSEAGALADAGTAVDAGAPATADAATADAQADAGAMPDAGFAPDTGAADGGGVSVVGQAELLSVKWWAGLCLGLCGGEATFKGAKIELSQLNDKKEVVEIFQGLWTTGTAAKLEQALGSLAGKTIQLSYGCPGCTDAAVYELTLAHSGTTTTVIFDSASVPADFQPLMAVLTPGLASLAACKTDALVVVSQPCPAGLP